MASPIPAGSQTPDASSVSSVYRAYLGFMSFASTIGHADLSHQLVLCQPLSVAGEAPMVAAGIASAGSLCIEPDPAAVRQSMRSGAIDFTVNNLDEALRALKNELRKGLSIAICLEAEPAMVLAEMEQRGLQPDILCCSPPLQPSLAVFVERGARVLHLEDIAVSHDMTEMSWWAANQPGKWLPRLDDLVATCIPAEDSIRRNWLKRAPRYLGRALRTRRYLPMTPLERSRCTEAFAQTIHGESWNGIDAHIQPLVATSTLHL